MSAVGRESPTRRASSRASTAGSTGRKKISNGSLVRSSKSGSMSGTGSASLASMRDRSSSTLESQEDPSPASSRPQRKDTRSTTFADEDDSSPAPQRRASTSSFASSADAGLPPTRDIRSAKSATFADQEDSSPVYQRRNSTDCVATQGDATPAPRRNSSTVSFLSQGDATPAPRRNSSTASFLSRASSKSDNGSATPFNQAMGVFKRLDVNHDGAIDRIELRFLLNMLDSKWTDDRADAVFEAIDLNKDGKIQFEELLRWTFSGGEQQDQSSFRQLVDLEDSVRSLVSIEVRTENGRSVFGPEEMLGSMTVAQLRRRVRSKAGVPVGCLMHGGETILRDSLNVGVYARGPTMELKMVEDTLSLLPEACLREFKELGVLEKFEGKTSIRLGISEPAEVTTGLMRKGDNDREFILVADGRLLAKEFRHRWHRSVATGKTRRSLHYGIAEGSFTLLDAASCHVEVSWNQWAEASGEAEEDSQTAQEVLQPWEARMTDDLERPPVPDHILPTKGGQVNVLVVARSWAGEAKKEGAGIGHMRHPNEGIAMPCVDEGVLTELDMSSTNLPYWLKGKDVG